jgi:hypothetical protein
VLGYRFGSKGNVDRGFGRRPVDAVARLANANGLGVLSRVDRRGTRQSIKHQAICGCISTIEKPVGTTSFGRRLTE